MFRDFLQKFKNSNNKRERGDSTSEGTSTATSIIRICKKMMMDDHSMDIDQVDSLQPMAGSSHSGRMSPYGLVPSIDDTNTRFSDLTPLERFVKILDHLDSRVEGIRKEALNLQGQADLLNMSIDLLKNHENMHLLEESQREEVECYVQRINGRLSTIELRVLTLRDPAQEESLHQVNQLIDELLLSSSDHFNCRQKCQQYLNACSTNEPHLDDRNLQLVVDKKFEMALLGCSLDDQKRVKQRLHSLLIYLSKKSLSD